MYSLIRPAFSSPIIVGNTPNPNYIVTGTGAATQIPLFSNLPVTSPTSGISFLNASNNVRIDAILTLAESRGLLKILSRPRVVTQNNIQALVRQGVRVPIVTQAQLGGPPTVTYVDAFLRLTVVPQITSEGTIFLNVDVENTTPDFGRTVQGNPTLITQQATTQVLVTDGGTVVIGGVIQTQNAINYQQVPFLGAVPVLGNLFKRKLTTRGTDEILFFITPRIYRPDYQGRPTAGTISNGTRTTSIIQPVTPGNPATNTPTPTELQQQQNAPQTTPGTPGQNLTTPVIQNPAGAPQGPPARPTSLNSRP